MSLATGWPDRQDPEVCQGGGALSVLAAQQL